MLDKTTMTVRLYAEFGTKRLESRIYGDARSVS